MAKELLPMDISNMPELLRLVQQVREEGRPANRRLAEDLVLEVRPLTRIRSKDASNATAIRRVLAKYAGALSEEQGERLKAHIYEAREAGSRPVTRP